MFEENTGKDRKTLKSNTVFYKWFWALDASVTVTFTLTQTEVQSLSKSILWGLGAGVRQSNINVIIMARLV